jgi:hypothetical protein
VEARGGGGAVRRRESAAGFRAVVRAKRHPGHRRHLTPPRLPVVAAAPLVLALHPPLDPDRGRSGGGDHPEGRFRRGGSALPLPRGESFEA